MKLSQSCESAMLPHWERIKAVKEARDARFAEGGADFLGGELVQIDHAFGLIDRLGEQYDAADDTRAQFPNQPGPWAAMKESFLGNGAGPIEKFALVEEFLHTHVTDPRKRGRENTQRLGLQPEGQRRRPADDSPIVGPNESVAEYGRRMGWYPRTLAEYGVSAGDMVVSMITGRRNPDVDASMYGGQSTAGAFLLSTPVAAEMVDISRPKSAIMNAGGSIIPWTGTSDAVRMVKVTGDPSASWRAESVDIPKTQATLGAIEFRAKTCAAIFPISVELAEDSPNAPEEIKWLLGTAFGTAWDDAALNGTGAGSSPRGILHHGVVNETDLSGEIDWDTLIDAIGTVEAANGTPNAYIVPSAVKNQLAKLKDGHGQYLPAPADVAALKRVVSNRAAATSLFLGDFSQVLIGMRTDIRIEILREGTYIENGERRSAASRLEVLLRAYMRMDVQIAHPEHLVRVLNIQAPA